MKCYEIELKGFDGSTDETDHLIKWIKAKDLSELLKFTSSKNWIVQNITKIHEGKKFIFEDGVDYIL